MDSRTTGPGPRNCYCGSPGFLDARASSPGPPLVLCGWMAAHPRRRRGAEAVRDDLRNPGDHERCPGARRLSRCSSCMISIEPKPELIDVSLKSVGRQSHIRIGQADFESAVEFLMPRGDRSPCRPSRPGGKRWAHVQLPLSRRLVMSRRRPQLRSVHKCIQSIDRCGPGRAGCRPLRGYPVLDRCRVTR